VLKNSFPQIQNLDPATSVSEIGPRLVRALQLLLNNNASTPAAVRTPSSSVAQKTKTTPSGPSWSNMLKRHKPEERKKVNEELSKLKYQPPVPHQNKTQEAFGFRQVTIRNIAERPIKETKITLFTLRIRLGKICNICKVGKATYEFLVDADYMRAFMNRMEQYGYSPMTDYDPLKPREENPTEEIIERIKVAGVTRIARTIMTTKMDDSMGRTLLSVVFRWMCIRRWNKFSRRLPRDLPHALTPVTISEQINQLEPDEIMSASPTSEASA